MSSALVLVGEAGIGKTRLLEHVAEVASDLHIVRVAGVETEARLGFAALHGLLRPFLGGLGELPTPQREALGSAFGMLAGPPADRHLVGMAALALLAGGASVRPVLCLIDDAHWLDRESRDALAFVGRRLGADAIGFVVADREPVPGAFEGLTVVPVGGLSDTDAHELLGLNVAGRLDPAVAARIVADTGGNPLALIESVGALSPACLAGTAPLLGPLPVGSSLENYFGQLIQGLPDDTRTFLVLLSATPPEDALLLWRASGELGIAAEAVDAAMSAGIIARGRLIEFRHPLIRSAVYRGADAAERRRVHAALAAASDPVHSRERRAWHRAEATIGLDEEVADELDTASELARARGGYAERAALLAKAAQLSVGDRVLRFVEAARAHLLLGDPAAAQSLLEQAEPVLAGADPVLRARAQHAKATTEIYFERIGGVLTRLLTAADTVADADPALSRSILMEGLLGALCGDLDPVALRQFGASVLTSPAIRSVQPTSADLLLRGFALRVDGDGYPQAAPVLRAALAAMGLDSEVIEHAVRPATLALYAADEVWDDRGGHEAALLVEAHERRVGALGALRSTLVVRSTWELRAGRFAAAMACLDESEDLATVVGLPSPGQLLRVELLAWSGQEAKTRAVADALIGDLVTRHANSGLADWARNCLAVLDISLGRYAEAVANARVAFDTDNAGAVARVLPDLVEAAVRCGDEQTAKDALRRLEERALPAGTPWALGLLARSRALLADDDHAEALFAESVALLGSTRVRTELARTHLLHGEWLRRRRRRADARAELRTAYEMFDQMGAAGFAERARVELQATGEHARKRTGQTGQTAHDLTPQERRIAGLAAAGATNAEIATRLFITQSTVEYHVNKVFRKLDITSRRQLRSVLQ